MSESNPLNATRNTSNASDARARAERERALRQAVEQQVIREAKKNAAQEAAKHSEQQVIREAKKKAVVLDDLDLWLPDECLDLTLRQILRIGSQIYLGGQPLVWVAEALIALAVRHAAGDVPKAEFLLESLQQDIAAATAAAPDAVA